MEEARCRAEEDTVVRDAPVVLVVVVWLVRDTTLAVTRPAGRLRWRSACESVAFHSGGREPDPFRADEAVVDDEVVVRLGGTCSADWLRAEVNASLTATRTGPLVPPVDLVVVNCWCPVES